MSDVPAKDLLRQLRDEVIPRERLRRCFPHALIASSVAFSGDVSRIDLGDDVAIWGPTVLNVADGGGLHGSSLRIGARTYIGEFNNIRAAGAQITIGADCLISQNITIVGTNHGTAAGQLIVDQEWTGAGVHIGDGVWIGAGAVLLPGARVHDGAVVAANAVVRGEVSAGSIVAGAPARRIGVRE